MAFGSGDLPFGVGRSLREGGGSDGAERGGEEETAIHGAGLARGEDRGLNGLGPELGGAMAGDAAHGAGEMRLIGEPGIGSERGEAVPPARQRADRLAGAGFEAETLGRDSIGPRKAAADRGGNEARRIGPIGE